MRDIVLIFFAPIVMTLMGIVFGVFLAERRKVKGIPVCLVCGEPCEYQFTGKGKPYLACDKHKVHALLMHTRKAGK